MPRPILPHKYSPSADETYMCPMHIEYFRGKLKDMLNELLNREFDNPDLSYREQDIMDQSIIDNYNELKLSSNQQRLAQINQVKNALKKIDAGEYGYCEMTFEEIGLERLRANPTARYCIEIQRKIEMQSRFKSSIEHSDLGLRKKDFG